MTTTTTKPVTIDPRLHTRALLVWLKISTWSARRYDKATTQKINREHSATSDAGRYNKNLLPGDAPSYKALTTLIGAIRAEHYGHTLAWSDEGWRCLTTANYMTYTEWYRQRSKDLGVAIDAFACEYPDLKRRARSLLNGLYDDTDYPNVDDIRSRFAVGISYMPLPAEGDIRVELGTDHVAYIESQVRQSVADSLSTAMHDAWSRLGDVVAHMADKLSTPDAVFRDSLVENTRSVVDTLKRLNVTDDSELERMRARVDKELTAYSAQGLRDFPRHRASVASKAQAILDDMRKNGVIA